MKKLIYTLALTIVVGLASVSCGKDENMDSLYVYPVDNVETEGNTGGNGSGNESGSGGTTPPPGSH